MRDQLRSPFSFASATRHNGAPMVPRSWMRDLERWESALGDKPLFTEAEIAAMKERQRKEAKREERFEVLRQAKGARQTAA